LEELRVYKAQIFRVYSHALQLASQAVAALELVSKPYGGEAPDAVFTCAGSSKPMFFVENGMTNSYWLQASWTAWVRNFLPLAW
jgi:3-dehydrosphinganine reductase